MLIGLIAMLFAWLDAGDHVPGRHRRADNARGPWRYFSTRKGRTSATMLVQWLIAERQSPTPLSFVDFTNQWRWKVYEEWQTTRVASGGW
jgi:hypothetical protein